MSYLVIYNPYETAFRRFAAVLLGCSLIRQRTFDREASAPISFARIRYQPWVVRRGFWTNMKLYDALLEWAGFLPKNL